MFRKSIALCAAALLILTFIITASAEEFDPHRNGSVSVTLMDQDKKAPIAGAELSLYYIATVGIRNDGNLSYTYTDTFAPADFAIDDPELVQKLESYILESNLLGTKVLTDADGRAVCSDIPLGLYFIRQTGGVEGFASVSPFLVTIPVKSSDDFVYDVNASPKTEISKLTDITIKKVWNTDSSTQAAESVTVQLLQNDIVIKTTILNEENNWQVTYTDMPESDAYSIIEVDIPKGFTATYSQEEYVFTVTNTYALIQTGQLIWPIPLLAVCGLILIAFGVMLWQKKGKRNA